MAPAVPALAEACTSAESAKPEGSQVSRPCRIAGRFASASPTQAVTACTPRRASCVSAPQGRQGRLPGDMAPQGSDTGRDGLQARPALDRPRQACRPAPRPPATAPAGRPVRCSGAHVQTRFAKGLGTTAAGKHAPHVAAPPRISSMPKMCNQAGSRHGTAKACRQGRRIPAPRRRDCDLARLRGPARPRRQWRGSARAASVNAASVAHCDLTGRGASAGGSASPANPYEARIGRMPGSRPAARP